MSCPRVRSSSCVFAVVLTVALGLAACGSGEGPTPTSPSASPAPTPSATPASPTTRASAAVAAPVVAASGEPSPSGWSCLGDPPDVAPGWRTEVAAVASSTPGALEKAMQGAQDKLRARVCVNADRDRAMSDACAFLASKIEPWKTGTNGKDTCASAVLKRQYVEEWERVVKDLDAFDRRLEASAKVLSEAATKARSAKSKGPGGAPRVALVAVYDDNDVDPKQNQLPGGRRADWLGSRLKARFSGGLVAAPKAWAQGQPLPADIDQVVVGRMWKRGAGDIPQVEVAWTGYGSDGREVVTSSGTFPEAAAPPPPKSVPPAVPTTDGLWLSMDSDHAGSICAGETTQLWLKSAEPLHVRVFDLWGTEGALLIFPEGGKSGLVAAGKTIPLGDEKGFEAVPLPGIEEERYLVVGAPTVAGLGKLAGLTSSCRLSPGDAARLHRGEGLPPGAKVAVTGYRLLSGSSCPKAPTPEHLEAMSKAIQRQPVCKL